jgi:hypothetical protein
MKEQLEFSIAANESRIFADSHEDGLWLSMSVRGGSAYTTMSKEAARELIAALTAIVEAE